MVGAYVRTDSLEVEFSDGTVALHDVAIALKPGEFVSIVGPSGCGKSTLLRVLAGLQEPSRGHVDTSGGHVSFVFQDPTLLPWLTAIANVQLPLRIAGVDVDTSAARARDALDVVGLRGHEHKLPKQLSGGMRMRVSVARALVTNPATFLFDEPFAAVDEIKREALNEMLLNIHQQQHFSAAFVTHSVSEAVFLADRVVVLSRGPGTIIAEIPVSLERPRHREQRFSPVFIDICRHVSEVLRQSEEPL
jgi:NitT/TauT family transport system ATP-binding protein